MATKKNRNYVRGRAAEEDLARILRSLGYTVERSPLSGQSARHRSNLSGAGWDLKMEKDGKSATISVKYGRSLPIGIYRVNRRSRIIAQDIVSPRFSWPASVSREWFKRAIGSCDRLAVHKVASRQGGWAWLSLEGGTCD